MKNYICCFLLVAGWSFANNDTNTVINGTNNYVSTNDVEELSFEMEDISSYLPTIYAIATGTDKGGLTYGGGARWMSNDVVGLGVEYRQFRPSVNFAGSRYRLRGNAACVYFALQSPYWNSLGIGFDLGGGVLWDDNNQLKISETWITSARLNINKQLGRYFDIVLFAGINYIGGFSVDDGRMSVRSKVQEIYDGGLAFRFHAGEVSKGFQRYIWDNVRNR